jgi:hypothetical protein
VADYCPNWWPASTRLLIRRVRLDVTAGAVSADPRARRRRTLHPDQRALPLDELAEADAVYGYSFIVTNLDVTSGEKAAAVEHWYRHRTQIENLLCATRRLCAVRRSELKEVEDLLVGLSQQPERSGAQPDPGDDGEGGKQR